MNAREEYELEQEKKKVSESCYEEAIKFWEYTKQVFSESSKRTPYIYSEVIFGKVRFTYSYGDKGEVEDMIDRTSEEADFRVVVLPIQLQEWYYREPRYSDEYVRYQLCQKLEAYVHEVEERSREVKI